MYHFPYFKEKDRQIVLDFIAENPFACLTGSFLSGEQVATQIPMLLEEKQGEVYLQGHIMRNTDHHMALLENPKALLLFNGPSCYVSASWYIDPYIGSTWNYLSVHIHGTVRFMTEEELIQFMRKLTLKFENGNSQSQTVYDNLPDAYLHQMMPAIVGFEVKADKMDNVFKLSQNRDEESYANIILKLKEQGGNSALIAGLMEERKAALFPKVRE